jgi:hypothetical protein
MRVVGMSEDTIAELYRQLKGLKLGVVAGVVFAVASAAVAWYQTRRDIADLQRDVHSIQGRADLADEWRGSTDKKLERIMTQNEYISEQIKELREMREARK